MSQLQDLINELCLNGVEYKTVEDVATITCGRVMSKDYVKENQRENPVYSPQAENGGELGCISTYDFDGEFLTWATDGANAGSVFYRNGKFSVTNVCGLIKVSESVILTRFLYFFLSVEAKKYVNSEMGNLKLMSNVISKIKVPIPPLSVQRKIVRILDNFTELITKITAELMARKKQYEYYRDSLLTSKKNNISMCTLRNIVKKSCSGATPAKGDSDYYINGTIPWIRTQDVRFNEITSVDSYITEKAVLETGTKWIPENCVIVAISGETAGRCAVNKIKATTNQHCLNLEIDESKALYKYAYYCIYSKYEELLNRK